MQIGDDEIEGQLLTFSLRPVEEIRALVRQHADAPQRRLAQRALAEEMVSLVHGADAALAATEAADLLFSADPTAASTSALEALAAEIPSSVATVAGLGDLVAVLVATGLASSNGDARRNLAQGSYSVNGVTIDEKSVPTEWERLQGRYVLLRKGKKTHHLLEISS
jgi:tyrosyl-tRNA synthetase